MLNYLHVKNLVLVKEAEINLSEQLNVLTGETGAGKSIIIGSIALALGAKADKDMIRSGQEYALVELVFSEERQEVKDLLKEMELPEEEDGTIILSRKLQPTRSIYKINGETVTAKQVKELAELLIDMHGQHEHESLMKESKQKALLDDYAGETLVSLKKEIAEVYKQYKELQAKMESLSMEEGQRERALSLALFEAEEIERADLTIGEGEEIRSLLRKMQNGQKISEGVGKAYSFLAENDGNALDQIGYAARELNILGGGDASLQSMINQIYEAEDIVRGLSRDLKDYLESLSFDEETFVEKSERLAVIDHLTMKYGKDEEAVLSYGQQKREEAENLKDLSATLEKLSKEKEQAGKKLQMLCEKAHVEREQAAEVLSKEITEVLLDLNFLKVSFRIAVEGEKDFGSDGYDSVSYLISMNPGEPMRPIAQVASGGELSRIMLALKCVFARKDAISTLVFDEIDTGISGKTAWKVATRMGYLSRNHQVIAITHLPQIAAFGDRHFVIEKNEEDAMTVTNIRSLSQEEMVAEIARVLAADTVSDTVLENAAELKEKADQEKQKMMV
ncbi:MAG: DNA repair protein RecN [Lachnospiraceae bacterium]|nr:DNA repair protein RecN [Lachnospiraceae bacterium]